MVNDPRCEVVSERGRGEKTLIGSVSGVFMAARGWEELYGKRDARATFSVGDIKVLVDGIEDFGGPLNEREVREALDTLVANDLCSVCGEGCYSLTAKGVSAEL